MLTWLDCVGNGIMHSGGFELFIGTVASGRRAVWSAAFVVCCRKTTWPFTLPVGSTAVQPPLTVGNESASTAWSMVPPAGIVNVWDVAFTRSIDTVSGWPES